jgi:hypothetical protein
MLLSVRLILGTILVCTKFSNDIYYGNHVIAQAGGLQTAELNLIERFLLNLLDYNLFVSTEEFTKFEEGLRIHIE